MKTSTTSRLVPLALQQPTTELLLDLEQQPGLQEAIEHWHVVDKG